MKLLEQEQSQQVSSILADPFKKDKWSHIQISIWNAGYFLNKKIDYKATVYFKNGLTKGEQVFEADDMESLMSKVQAFMITLP